MSTDDSAFERERTMSPEEYQAALAALQQENAELRDKYLRAAAALENARKQAERVATARTIQELRNLYLRFLEVADNMERALSYAAEGDRLAPGVKATLRQLLDILRQAGVTPLDAEPGAPFDPRFHEAVETHEGNVPEATVMAVSQPGYLFEGQVLRPARVVVTRPARSDA
jgi:molecular chaperone GrpE